MSLTKIRDLISEERPREKIVNYGEKVLTDVELLALVIRSGGKEKSSIDTSRDLIKHFGSLNKLVNCEIEELINFKNIGIAKASGIKAACEIGLRISNATTPKNTEVSCPEDVYWILRRDLFGKDEEHLFLISLDSRNKLISKDLISRGSVNETVVSPREIYKKAFQRNAVSIILAHNHPSNDVQPSTEDIKITERIAKTGLHMGIPLIDHIIVGTDNFSSMKSLNLFTSKKLNRKEV